MAFSFNFCKQCAENEWKGGLRRGLERGSGGAEIHLYNVAVDEVVLGNAAKVEVTVGFVDFLRGDTDVVQCLCSG